MSVQQVIENEEELSDEEITLLLDNYEKILKESAEKLSKNYNNTIFYY